MKRKMFSILLAFVIFCEIFCPVFAEGATRRAAIEKSANNEELALVTETMPADSVKDKYVKILFVPETHFRDGHANFGSIVNEDGKKIELGEEVIKEYPIREEKTVKAKAFYALKTASWKDILNYEENGKKVFYKLKAVNDETDEKIREEHEFLGWTFEDKNVINPYNQKFFPLEEIGSVRSKHGYKNYYSMEQAIIFKSKFQVRPYIFRGNVDGLQMYDSHKYPIIADTDYRKGRFVIFENDREKGKFEISEFQKEYFMKQENYSSEIRFFVKKDATERSLGLLKPITIANNNCMFWYWCIEGNPGRQIENNHELLTKNMIDYRTYYAKFLKNGEEIRDKKLTGEVLPEGVYAVTLNKEADVKYEKSKYNKIYAVFEGSTLKIIGNLLPTPLAVDNSKKAYWYLDDKKVDNIKDIPITRDMTFTAKVEKENEKYEVSSKNINKNYGASISEDEILNSVTTTYPSDSTLQPTKAIIDGQVLPDGKTSGEFEIKVEVKYPDDSTSEVLVKIIVGKSQAETFVPDTKPLEVNKNEELTIEKFKSVITNLPQDITDILIKENADTSEVGDKTAKLTITFKDSSKLDVTIKVKVKEIIEAGKITPIPEINTENIEVEEVAYKGKINLTDNIKNLPEGAIVIDVSEEKIDTTKAGNYEGKVKVTFKNGSSRIVTVPVKVLKSQAETFVPDTKPLEVNKNEEITIEKLKSVITNLPQDITDILIKENADTSEVGDKTTKLTITFKDSSKLDVTINVKVKEVIPEKRDAEKNPIVVPRDLKVRDKNNLSNLEIENILEQFRILNPKARDIKIDEKGNVTLIYEDNSQNILNILKYLVEAQEKDKDKDFDKKDNKEDSSEDDYYASNYFEGLVIRDHKTKTYPVNAIVPKKVIEENKSNEKTSYVFHINEFEYEIIENGISKKIKMDISPVIKNERTMLPLRNVAEVLGAEVFWNEKTRTASFTKDGLTASIQIDDNKIILSSGEVIEMESKPLNISDRIFVSLVNVGNVFGLKNGNTSDGEENDIEWDNESKTVTIYVK
ncbi:Rib/alpha-like domain-containing protein [Peptoniphilus senegalensis]|uniref:Rib/alpha-like domain-containing protein n=1 Tax=Peptoniphilus senegalensis TaxID=1465757 RepID=A0ABV1J1S6_9FIRM